MAPSAITTAPSRRGVACFGTRHRVIVASGCTSKEMLRRSKFLLSQGQAQRVWSGAPGVAMDVPAYPKPRCTRSHDP